MNKPAACVKCGLPLWDLGSYLHNPQELHDASESLQYLYNVGEKLEKLRLAWEEEHVRDNIIARKTICYLFYHPSN